MPQSRAQATRQTIIDAAVELFADRGYGETALTDITKRAGVTTGAFYYHFPSREAVATAIVRQGWPKAVEVLDHHLKAPGPGLENVIAMTFALSELMKRDMTVWVANHLNQGFAEFSREGRDGFKKRAQTFTAKVAGTLNRNEIRDDFTEEQVGNLVWIAVHGCHLLSDAMSDNVFDRLALSWRTMLAAIAPEESLHHYEQFVKRTAARY